MAYTTAQKVSDFTEGEVPVGSVQDEWLAWVDDWIEARTGIKWDGLATVTDEKHDGDGTASLFTKKHPLDSVTSLSIDGEAVAAADFKAYPTGRVELEDEVFPKGLQNVKITYKHGYASVPSRVEALATALVAQMALGAEAGHIVERKKIGSYSATVSGKRLDSLIASLLSAVGIRNEAGAF